MPWLDVVIALMIIGTCSTFIYHYVYYLPQSRADLRACLNTASGRYTDTWGKYCALIKEEASCSLPNKVADDLELKLRQDKDDCFKIYTDNK